MKKIILSLLILSSIFSVQSQNIAVNWGEKYKEDKGDDLKRVLYDDGQYVYAHIENRDKKGKVTPGLVKFDGQLNQMSRQDFLTNEDGISYYGIKYFGGNFMMLTAKYEKKTNTRELFANVIDKDFKMVNSGGSIWKIVGKKGEEFDYNFSYTEDSSKFLIYVNPRQEKKQNERFAFKLVDKDFKTLSEKLVELPYTEDEFVVLDLIANNNGDVFVFGKAYTTGSSKKEKVKSQSGARVAAYKLVMKRYSLDGSEKDFTFDVGGRFMSDYYIKTDNKGNLYLAALYEEELDKGVNGFFYFNIDANTGEVLNNSSWTVPVNLAAKIKGIHKDKIKSKKPALSDKFEFTDFIILTDKMYLIAEKNYRVWVQMKYGGYWAYFSQSMIAFQLDKKGNVQWHSYIPKLQYYASLTLYQYHTTMVKDNRLHILYNDEMKKRDYPLNSTKPPKRMNAIKEMLLVMVSFDENGKAEKNIIGDSKKMETNILIPRSYQTKHDRFFLYGYQWKTKENRLGLATFH
ncbi:MAG: hypothetical protein ACR2GN_03200 [Bacteroidia bacterium]